MKNKNIFIILFSVLVVFSITFISVNAKNTIKSSKNNKQTQQIKKGLTKKKVNLKSLDCQKFFTLSEIKNACGLKQLLSFDKEMASYGYCGWLIENASSDMPEIIRKLSGGNETVLQLYFSPPVGLNYDEYRDQISDFFGSEAEIDEQNDVGSKSFSISVKDSHELVFIPTGEQQVLRLLSPKCSLDGLKVLGKALIKKNTH